MQSTAYAEQLQVHIHFETDDMSLLDSTRTGCSMLLEEVFTSSVELGFVSVIELLACSA